MDNGDDWRSCGEGELGTGRRQLMYNSVDGYSKCCWDVKSSKSGKEFPPPIPSIGKSGKPWVCLKSYREDGPVCSERDEDSISGSCYVLPGRMDDLSCTLSIQMKTLPKEEEEEKTKMMESKMR